MARLEERRFTLRDFDGVDLTVNARVTSPGSWRVLSDFWMPEPGRLEQRPGTAEFAIKVTTGEYTEFGDWTDPPDTIGYPAVLAHLNPELAIIGKFNIDPAFTPKAPFAQTLPGMTVFIPTSDFNSTFAGSVIFNAGF